MKSVLYLLWKWIISDNKFCLLTQCAKSKISSLYVVAKPSSTCTITFMFYIWKCLEKHVFLEHVHWVHIQYTFLALFFKILSEYSVQTICQLQTCHVLHVVYCPSYLNGVVQHFDVHFYWSGFFIFIYCHHHRPNIFNVVRLLIINMQF